MDGRGCYLFMHDVARDMRVFLGGDCGDSDGGNLYDDDDE